MSTTIHPLAVVDPKAELGEDVTVGPFCVVEGGARIGARTVFRSHVVASSFAEIGEERKKLKAAEIVVDSNAEVPSSGGASGGAAPKEGAGDPPDPADAEIRELVTSLARSLK